MILPTKFDLSPPLPRIGILENPSAAGGGLGGRASLIPSLLCSAATYSVMREPYVVLDYCNICLNSL